MSPSEENKKKLVLIDGNAIIHRAYHAMPPLTDKNDEPINAVYGFVSMILKIIQDLEPTHLAVCFDREEPTFRHEEFEDYQAHRPEADEELKEQFDKVYETVDAFGIPRYSKVGYEADDLVGTLAKKAEDKVDEVVIVTGDKDILQLVTDKTHVFLPVRGLSNGKLMKEEDVIEKMGVKPDQVPDLKGFMGDPSDNYPGVYGIGPKTAQKLLQKYETFEGVYEHLDELKENTRKKLEEGKENAEVSYKLAQIIQDAPVELDLDEMTKWQVDGKEVLALFAKFGFKTLTNRVKDIGKAIKGKDQMLLL